MKKQFSFMAFVFVVICAFSAFGQQASEDDVYQEYLYVSAAKGVLSSSTMTFKLEGGNFEKLKDGLFLLQLSPGNHLDCQFTLPDKAFDVKVLVTYNVQNEGVKSNVILNNTLLSEEQSEFAKEKKTGLIQKAFPLKEFQLKNELRIAPETEPIQILNVAVLYSFRISSNTAEQAEQAQALLKEALKKIDDSLKNDPNNKDYQQLKQRIADQFMTEAIKYSNVKGFDLALTRIDKALDLYPDNNEYKQTKQLIVEQIVAESLHFSNEKKFDDAFAMIDKALKIYPDNNEYKQVKQKITADPFAADAITLFNEKKFDDALAKIDNALKIYPDSSEYKQVKQKITAEQYAAEALKLTNEKKFDEAFAKIEKALEIIPEYKEYIISVKQKIVATIFSPDGRKAGDRVVITIKGVKFAFRWCPPGTFTMGSPETEEGRRVVLSKVPLLKKRIGFTITNEIQHQVTLSKGFWMMETEVTVGMFKAFVNDTGYESNGNTPIGYDADLKADKHDPQLSWRNPGFGQDDNHPVTFVSWYDAVEFCKWLSKKIGQNITLPTEAQWEYACRAGTTGPYAGNLDEMAWWTSNSGHKTHQVGTKKPNAWGLYDMHGNVSEWCQDWYGDYPSGSVTDPTGPSSGSFRVYRGGSMSALKSFYRSASRLQSEPESRYYGKGFRCTIGQ